MAQYEASKPDKAVKPPPPPAPPVVKVPVPPPPRCVNSEVPSWFDGRKHDVQSLKLSTSAMQNCPDGILISPSMLRQLLDAHDVMNGTSGDEGYYFVGSVKSSRCSSINDATA